MYGVRVWMTLKLKHFGCYFMSRYKPSYTHNTVMHIQNFIRLSEKWNREHLKFTFSGSKLELSIYKLYDHAAFVISNTCKSLSSNNTAVYFLFCFWVFILFEMPCYFVGFELYKNGSDLLFKKKCVGFFSYQTTAKSKYYRKNGFNLQFNLTAHREIFFLLIFDDWNAHTTIFAI